MGFCVPHVPSAMRRLRNAGVRVIKDVGELPTGKMFGFERELAERFAGLVARIGFVADPDGYWVEIVPSGNDAATNHDAIPDFQRYLQKENVQIVDSHGTKNLATGAMTLVTIEDSPNPMKPSAVDGSGIDNCKSVNTKN